MKFEPDAWLSQVFGYPVFKVTLDESEGEPDARARLEAFLRETSQGRPAFYFARVPTRRIDQVNALTQVGFRVVDVNVSLEREPGPASVPGSIDPLVRDFELRDREAVLGIAASCFAYSRFHLDPRIPRALADSVKRAWADSYFQGTRGDRLLVAEEEGALVGFLAILSRTGHKGRERVIDLVGVAKCCQGRGVGRRLVQTFIAQSAGRAASLRVGTQAANVPSIRLYERCGFRTSETTYVLHAHVEKGSVGP
ncbi:MAG: GNAT family N-acetyltransferase [Verrucomicrobia bacterium]|nr:GNAT family N-acetyltransferase [Verrucomicrobiota bacterium]